MKKSILVLIAVMAIGFSSYGQTYYNYAYSYDYGNKKLYVSNIISHNFKNVASGTMNDSRGTDFRNQWVEKFEVVCNEGYYDYNMEVWLWNKSRSKIEELRNKTISEYKRANFSIVYVKSFYYSEN